MGLRKIYFSKKPVMVSVKEKITRLDFTTILNFCTINKIKKKATKWEEIIQHMFHVKSLIIQYLTGYLQHNPQVTLIA